MLFEHTQNWRLYFICGFMLHCIARCLYWKGSFEWFTLGDDSIFCVV